MDYSNIQDQLGALKDDLLRLRGDLSGVLKTMLEATRAEAGETRENLENKAREQLDRLAAAAAGAREGGHEIAGRVCSHIEDHPMASVLGALGAGFLIGVLASRK